MAALSHGVGVHIVHAQARHHVGIEDDLEAPAGARDDHVGHDHVALHVDEAAARLGFEARDQAERGARGLVVDAAEVAQALHVALGHELQRLVADGERGARLGRVAQLQDLQAQAFAQVARAHARGLHVLQQLQRHREALFQRLARLQRVVRVARELGRAREVKPGVGQLGQAFLQVAVVVERLDQEVERGAVLVRQAQAASLVVQVVLQADRGARQVGGAGGLVVVARTAVARGRVATPLAVVGRHLHRAIALPAFLHRGGAVQLAFQAIAVTAVGACAGGFEG